MTEALDTFAFNVAVARLHELTNALLEAERAPTSDLPINDEVLSGARREAAGLLARLIAPMAPHLAETANALLDPGSPLLATQPWPEADPVLVAVDQVTVAVQVMGKLRATLHLPPGADAATAIAAAEAEPAVARLLDGRRVVKRIHVPDRIVNFVVAG